MNLVALEKACEDFNTYCPPANMQLYLEASGRYNLYVKGQCVRSFYTNEEISLFLEGALCVIGIYVQILNYEAYIGSKDAMNDIMDKIFKDK